MPALLPIPKYVIHRYFPKFSGYSRIAPTSLFDNMRRLAVILMNLTFISLSLLMINVIFLCLNNAYKRCEECPDLIPDNFDEYYRLHIQYLEYVI